MSNQLQKILNAKGLTHGDVADALGVSRQAVSLWATKGTPTAKNLGRLSSFLGVRVGQITGDEPFDYVVEEREDVAPESGWTRVPVLDAYGSCGAGVPASNAVIVGMMTFNDDFLRSLPGVFGIQRDQFELISACGDSMEPTIYSQSLALVDKRQTEIYGDGIYVFVNGEDVLIKRVQVNLNRSITLISDNPRYRPQTIARDELGGAHVFGRVVYVLNGQKV